MQRSLETLTWIIALLGCLLTALGPGDSSSRGPRVRDYARTPRLCVAVRAAATRAPVAGAELRVYAEHAGAHYPLTATQRTAGNGLACLDHHDAQVAWVVTEAGGFARASRRVVSEAGASEARVEFILEPEQRLSVLVVDELGQPIERATVLVVTADPLPFGALTAASGHALVSRLPRSPWAVRAHAAGFESASADGVQRDVRLVLRRLAGIDVRVVDLGGAPVAGASVLIAGSSLWPARRASTDGEGLARLRALPEGSYDLRASRDTRASPTLHGFELARGAQESLTLTLAPGRMVSVVVTDGEGEAAPVVSGADVVLVEGGVASFPLHGRSNAQGKVVLGPIAAGPATLSARAPDFVGGPLVVVPEVLEGPVRVPLVRGGRLRGQVVDDRDFPVEGASIEIIGTDRYGLPIAETPLVTSFRAVHFEWSLGGPSPLIPAGELGVMPGPVPPIPRAGMYRPPSTSPLPLAGSPASAGADPGLSNTAADYDLAPWVSDSGGEFDARPITPGRVRALVRHPDYVETVSDAVIVGSAGEATVRVVLLRGGAVEGRVVDDRGFPVEGAQVLLTADRGTFERRSVTSQDGSFAFAAAPAKVTIALDRPDDPGRHVLTRTLEVPENGRTELELVLPPPRQSVRVQVVDGNDQAVELAEVRMLSLEPAVPLRKTVFTGEDGSAEITDAAALPVRLLVDAPRFSAVELWFEHVPAEVRVVLESGVIVSGRVTAVRGRQGVPNAIVTLRGAVQRRSTSTDGDGLFRFESVAPGAVELRVSHPEYAEASASVHVEATGRADRPFELAAIDLQEPGIVEGRVIDAQGNAVDGARIGVGFVATYLPEGALPVGIVLSDSRGEFVLRGVAPGVRKLSAYSAGAGRGELDEVEVNGGRTTSGLVIRLSPAPEAEEPFATGGLAVTLGERATDDGPEVVLLDVTPGSEAERGGVRAGDAVLAIDGHEPTSMLDARSRLAGRAGTDVVLELRRSDTTLKLRVTRQAVRR